MPQFRKKPVVIEARQVVDDSTAVDSMYELAQWCDGWVDWDTSSPTIEIATLEGTMSARIGDYIIKGVNGEFYPCKPDIFEKTYDPVE